VATGIVTGRSTAIVGEDLGRSEGREGAELTGIRTRGGIELVEDESATAAIGGRQSLRLIGNK
jgi:hypothetical protein